MARLFFALWPDHDIQAELAGNTKDTLHHSCRHVSDKNTHLTVVFLGNIGDRVQSTLINKVSNIRVSNFAFNIDQQGWWKQPKICWEGPSSVPSALFRLKDAIRQITQELKLAADHRPFKPHLTLAHKVNRPVKFYFKPIHWKVRDFCLIESITHPGEVEYKIIQQWPLTLG